MANELYVACDGYWADLGPHCPFLASCKPGRAIVARACDLYRRQIMGQLRTANKRHNRALARALKNTDAPVAAAETGPAPKAAKA